MGLIYPTAGTIRILGMDARDNRVKQQIGFLPEQPYFYDYLTPRELLGYYARLSGMTGAEIESRMMPILRRVRMEEHADTQLRKFSKGMLQRVGIAQAIIHDPKVVFLDEPMSGLDPVGRREVRDLIEGLRDEGKTIFFSTHILADAEALCDRVAVLHQGELRGITLVADLARQAAGKVEVIASGLGEAATFKGWCAEVRTVGETTRLVVNSESLEALLDKIRGAGGRLISVNPLRANLEDYFLQHVKAPKTPEQTS